jgi:NADH-quinone oxidoreductase subunit G
MFADYELIITSKILMKKLGFSFFSKKNNININDYYLHYLNPNFFQDINEKTVFTFVGYNLRLESPILNIKLRKRGLRDSILYLSFGSNFNDNLNSKNEGLNIINLIKYLQGKRQICNFILKKMNKKIDFFNSNLFLLGNNIVNRVDSKSIFHLMNQQCNLKLNKKNYILNKNYLSSFFVKYSKEILLYFFENSKINVSLNILYVNLTNLLYEEFSLYKNINNINKVSENDLVYLLGIDMFNKINSKFTVFQGHHLNLDNLNVDLIFPSTTFLEKFSNYINIEGNVLQTNFVLYPPFFCRND